MMSQRLSKSTYQERTLVVSVDGLDASKIDRVLFPVAVGSYLTGKVSGRLHAHFGHAVKFWQEYKGNTMPLYIYMENVEVAYELLEDSLESVVEYLAPLYGSSDLLIHMVNYNESDGAMTVRLSYDERRHNTA